MTLSKNWLKVLRASIRLHISGSVLTQKSSFLDLGGIEHWVNKNVLYFNLKQKQWKKLPTSDFKVKVIENINK